MELMTDTLAHRGPNDRGTWSDGEVALGARRLSVIDLSMAGHQPMSNEDGTVWLVFNGEIYNFRELKAEFKLTERGHSFRSRTDTEVLIHLYEELGQEMFAKLNGMFAMAIWDRRNHELHLARDRYGIKPLFYQEDPLFFRFGSEIKAILADKRVQRKPSLQALHDFLTFDYIPGPQSAFEGISELPPGQWMTVNENGYLSIRKYWEPSFKVDDSIDEKAAIEEARELLDRAVKRQLVADVPVGVLLSGGMDSSTLVALMHRHTRKSIHTYSVGFQDSSFNELPYARIVAQTFHTTHREVVVTPQIVRELLVKHVSYIDEPYADGSAIPTYCVCELAKGEVVVLLSGEGGDEAFAGYDTYAAYRASRWFSRVPRWVRNGIIGPVVHSLPVSHHKLSLEFKMKRFLSGQDLPPAQAHLWWRVVLTEDQKRALYRPEVLENINLERSDRFFIETFENSAATDELNKLLHIDAAVFLPDDLMVKNDRMSMAHSLEARVPMTDNEVTAFMSRVSPRFKLPGLRKKYIMRRALQGILPPAILKKKKVGLEMPYSAWFKNELKDLLLSYCNAKRISETGLFRPEAVNSVIEEHLASRGDHGRALWGLMNFMVWHELYIAKPSAAAGGNAD
jgi:asparagine synthase (glutamine-hydrolysing)